MLYSKLVRKFNVVDTKVARIIGIFFKTWHDSDLKNLEKRIYNVHKKISNTDRLIRNNDYDGKTNEDKKTDFGTKIKK